MNPAEFSLFMAAAVAAGLVVGRLLARIIIQGGRRP
jgi:hypothetical protein